MGQAGAFRDRFWTLALSACQERRGFNLSNKLLINENTAFNKNSCKLYPPTATNKAHSGSKLEIQTLELEWALFVAVGGHDGQICLLDVSF